ncbi:MAG: hypothetical protein CO094_13250 [Anaerolineae bacterium CG_4_9_14_3_um_filter_57_17]|nr:MAG: hypothetical protein AUK01_09790 [Anaerolineae bacterium CG2_30_57_67]PJB64406.1 MAG: hypothetical protein CO094_13250 [Anaerolineae bacterium CG_4_9_14_3_um_filter_57_17]
MKKKIFQPQKQPKGQILVLLALMMILLIAIIGLAIDVGFVYVNYARLRRGVDGAAVNAANQFKENYTITDLKKAAREFLVLNDVPGAAATVETCDSNPAVFKPGDCPDLVADPTALKRKLVYVEATMPVDLFFLSVIGISSTTVRASSTSEAASVDVILAIDTSDSMAWEGDGIPGQQNGPLEDPSICNADNSGDTTPGECHPFEEIKVAALAFADQLYFPYDRVGIVTFDTNPNTTNNGAPSEPSTPVLELSNTFANVQGALRGLNIYQGNPCPPPDNGDGSFSNYNMIGRCRAYDSTSKYIGGYCPIQKYNIVHGIPASIDESWCNNTNIGGGLQIGGNTFSTATPVRNEALWVMILLTDGIPNFGYGTNGTPFCPEAYIRVSPQCQDNTPSVRHTLAGSPTLYDVDDYARDMADNLVNQDVIIFAIGLGADTALPAADSLLHYIAEDAAAAINKPKGIYYPGATASQLQQIFQAIANNIATRIAH